MGNLCQDHWDRLRKKIDERGLTPLVAESGEEAMQKTMRQMDEGETIDTFEPLMGASNTILANAMDTIGSPNSLYLLSEGPEDPVDIRMYGEEYEGRTWPKCPLCYLNLAHEVSCGGCSLPTKNGFDYWLDKAADAALARWKELKP